MAVAKGNQKITSKWKICPILYYYYTIRSETNVNSPVWFEVEGFSFSLDCWEN